MSLGAQVRRTKCCNQVEEFKFDSKVLGSHEKFKQNFGDIGFDNI